MSAYITLNNVNLSAVAKRIDVWLQSTHGIGRAQIILDLAETSPPTLNADHEITAKIGAATLFRGYIDVYKIAERLYKIRQGTIFGRDWGQDLANKSYEEKIYLDEKADDLIDDLLNISSSEIAYTSPSTAPVVSYLVKNELNLNTLRKIAEWVNYDFYVDLTGDSPVLKFFPIGSLNSEVTLKSVLDDPTNNIISAEKTHADGLEIKNKVILIGREVDDGWTQENAIDWDCQTGYQTANEYTITGKYGASIKSYWLVGGLNNYLGLIFPLYHYDYLDWSKLHNEIMSWLWRHDEGIGANRKVFVEMEDDLGNKIRYHGDSTNVPAPLALYKLSVPIAQDSEVFLSETDDAWYRESGSAFTWKVKKIKWFIDPAVGTTGTIYIDDLRLPKIFIKGISEDGESQSAYKRRDFPQPYRPDFYFQKSIQKEADSILEKTKGDYGSMLRVFAKGSAGIVDNVSKWLPGYYMTVNIPRLGLNSVNMRLVNIHHIITLKDEIEAGHDYIVEANMCYYNRKIDIDRFGYIFNPDIALLRNLEKKIEILGSK